MWRMRLCALTSHRLGRQPDTDGISPPHFAFTNVVSGKAVYELDVCLRPALHVNRAVEWLHRRGQHPRQQEFSYDTTDGTRPRRTLVRANLNDLLDRAEDPEKMLDQLVRDYRNAINEARTEVAATVGNLRMTEEDLSEARGLSMQWGRRPRPRRVVATMPRRATQPPSTTLSPERR